MRMILLSLLVIFTSPTFADEEIEVTAAIDQMVNTSVENYFDSIGRELKEINFIKGYQCDESDCLFYVESLALAQKSIAQNFVIFNCITYFNGSMDFPVALETICD